MDECKNETWCFSVTPDEADGVYLVVDGPTAPSRWIPMQRNHNTPGQWSATAEIAPGRSRLRYFTVEGAAYLNCGNVGLTGERTSAFEPAVQIENTGLAASA